MTPSHLHTNDLSIGCDSRIYRNAHRYTRAVSIQLTKLEPRRLLSATEGTKLMFNKII